MGNQCCTTQNTTPDLNNAPGPAANRPYSYYGEGEEGEEGHYEGTKGANVNAAIQMQEELLRSQDKNSAVLAAAIEEDNENKIAVSTFKFNKQLENLRRAAGSADELQQISVEGAKVSHAIADLNCLIQLLSESLFIAKPLRDLKAILIGLYGDMQLFRSFHLRYTLDKKFFKFTAIDELSRVLKIAYSRHTKEGKTNYEEFSKDLASGLSHNEFLAAVQEIKALRAVYNTIQNTNFSTLPNYIYITLSESRGFDLWTRLFPFTLETSYANFSEAYGKECGIPKQDIHNIISLLDSSNDQRVDIYQWIDFVFNFPDLLDQESRLHPSAVSTFAAEIQIRKNEVRIVPQKIGDAYHYPSGMVYIGALDTYYNRQGQARLTDEGYEFEGFFLNDLAHGQGYEVRKGIVYTGEFKNGLYHGQGSLEFPNGRKYVGAFEDHSYHGQGHLVGDDGIAYEGIWRNGQLSHGKINYHDGSVYIGQLKNSFFKHDKGELRIIKTSFFPHAANIDRQLILSIDGIWNNDTPARGKLYTNQETVMYDGLFSNWAISTKGKRIYVDGSYEGELIRDNKQGTGLLIYKNGDQFDGKWNDDIQVTGAYFFGKDKTHRYEGEWTNGLMEGYGKFFYPSGGVYEGYVKNAQRHGKGTYKYHNGNIYVGDWINNNQEGEGNFKYESGDYYNGQFIKGKFHGFGQYVYTKTGKQYIGFWERDQWNGEGKFLDMNGKALKCGFWKDDKLQTAMKEEEIMFKNENKHLIIQPQ